MKLCRLASGSVAATLSLVLVVVFTGCGGRGDRSTETADSAVIHAAERRDSAGVLTVPPPPDTVSLGPPVLPVFFPHPATVLAADSAAGQSIYRRAAGCVGCHGTRAEGVAGLGSSLSDDVWQRGDGSLSLLYGVIRDGISDAAASRVVSPGVGGRLTPQEIFQVAAYVYTLSHPASTVADSMSLRPGSPPIARAPADTLSRF